MILAEVSECHEKLIRTIVHHEQHESLVAILELTRLFPVNISVFIFLLFSQIYIALKERLLVDEALEQVVLTLSPALL